MVAPLQVEDGNPDVVVVKQAGFPHAVVTKDRAKHRNNGFNDERRFVVGESSAAGVAAKDLMSGQVRDGIFSSGNSGFS